MTLREITDLVAIRLDEFPECRLALQPTSAARSSLAEMTEVLLEPVARDLTRAAPLSQFAAPADMRPHIRSEADWGEDGFAEVELPADFCRLHSLRMERWGLTLTDDFHGDPLRAALGETAPAWLTAQTMRPWLRIMRHDDRATMRFGPVTEPMPLAASYIPLPEYDAAERRLNRLDPSLLFTLSERIADLLRHDF